MHTPVRNLFLEANKHYTYLTPPGRESDFIVRFFSSISLFRLAALVEKKSPRLVRGVSKGSFDEYVPFTLSPRSPLEKRI